jgi:hypothetical protein
MAEAEADVRLNYVTLKTAFILKRSPSVSQTEGFVERSGYLSPFSPRQPGNHQLHERLYSL